MLYPSSLTGSCCPWLPDTLVRPSPQPRKATSLCSTPWRRILPLIPYLYQLLLQAKPLRESTCG